MYNIELLAKLSGLTRRTVRYYIQIGLLEPPLGTCRGSYYTDGHLNRLNKIKNWSNQGVPLNKIKEIIEGVAPSVTVDSVNVVCTAQWERLELCDGIELHFRNNYLRNEELKKINAFIQEVIHCRNYEDENEDF